MKKFTVLSREAARQYSYKHIGEKTIIISITDVASLPNKFCSNVDIVAVCRVSFDDVEKGQMNCITKEDAQKILDFMEKHNDVNNVIVHCEAGISRSAGVCAALMWIFNGSDMDIFSNPKFKPNMTAYRTVINTHMNFDGDWQFPEN